MRSLALVALCLAACRPSAVAQTGSTVVTVSNAADARALRLTIEPMPEPRLLPLRAVERARCGNGEMLEGLDVSIAPVALDDGAAPRVRAFRLRCVEVSLVAGAVSFGAERLSEWHSLTGARDATPTAGVESLRCAARTAAVDLSLDYAQEADSPRRGLRGVTLRCANVASRTTSRGVMLWGEESASSATQQMSPTGGVVACGGVGLDQGALTSVATGLTFVPEGADEVGNGALGPLCSVVSVGR